MALISVTRLRLRSWRFLFAFARLTMRTQRQVQRAPGYLGGELLPDRRLTFWTLTAWEDEAAMRAAILSGDHRAAMPKLADWCDEASVVHWSQAAVALPDWAEAERRMRAEGRASRVRRGSAQHAALEFDPPRTAMRAPLPPLGG